MCLELFVTLSTCMGIFSSLSWHHPQKLYGVDDDVFAISTLGADGDGPFPALVEVKHADRPEEPANGGGLAFVDPDHRLALGMPHRYRDAVGTTDVGVV